MRNNHNLTRHTIGRGIDLTITAKNFTLILCSNEISDKNLYFYLFRDDWFNWIEENNQIDLCEVIVLIAATCTRIKKRLEWVNFNLAK